MKQVININFQGRVVPIEVTAFEILKGYTESLNRYFSAEEGKDEIINDIESRIGELFQQRLKEGSTCITEEDVNAIIKSMGRPEDFETESGAGTSTENSNPGNNSSNAGTGSSQSFQSAGTKRLYRDENDKVVGGVCSGLANYFGIDVVVVRIIFVVLAVSFGFGLIPYLILWVAVPSTAANVIGGTRKKLYRDMEDKYVAGVSSGIANYFGINAWIPRLLFLLPFLSFVSRWSHWGDLDFPNFIRFGFSPGSLLVYIILWLVIPEAKSTTEKLEMKGEKVDMNSIKNSVMEEIKGVQERAQKFGKEATGFTAERTKTFTAEANAIARRGSRGFGDILAFLIKMFVYFIIGCVLFSLVVALFGLGIAAVGFFPMKDFILNDGTQSLLAWGTLIFFIVIPIIGIITWIIRRVTKSRANSKTMRAAFGGLWFVGLICAIALVTSVVRDFRYSNSISEETVLLSNPTVNKLEVTTNSPTRKYYRNRWFKPFDGLEEDTAYVQNVRVHIIRTTGDSFRVTMMRMASGPNKSTANKQAGMIDYNAVQMDSLLVIDRGIAITKQDKFRNQRIVLTIYMPVGKQIRINRNVGWGYDFNFGNDGDDDVQFEDLEHGWSQNVDYVMKADGLYTLAGDPADEWKHPRKKEREEDADDDNNNSNGSGYRYNRSDSAKPASRQDSLKKQLRIEEKRVKDSLQKIKKDAEDQLKKMEDKGESETAMNNYVLPAYSPMMITY